MSTTSSDKSNFWWYIAAAVVLIIILAVTSYEVALPVTPLPTPTPTTIPTASSSTSPSSSPTTSPSSAPSTLTLYAGAVNSGSGTYGFGLSASDIISPGPTLNLVEGTTYTLTVYNTATDMEHSFEISPTQAIANSPLFGAGIDINTYIAPSGSGSVTFTPNQTGNFYYVCTVPGHISLGMWGKVVVTS